MKKINVLHFLTTSNIRGSENLVMNMISNGNLDKFNYYICTLFPHGKLYDLCQERGIKIFSLNTELNFIFAFFRLRNLMKMFDVDIIHVYGLRVDLLTRFSSLFTKRKIVVSAIHSVCEKCPRVVFFVDKFFSSFVDLYISNSHQGAEFHKMMTGIKSDKYSVIHSGIDTDEFKSGNTKEFGNLFREKNNISNNGLIISLLAGITGEKGHDIALDALEEIIRTHPNTEIKLIFIGKDYTNGNILNLIESKGLEDSVLLLGHCDLETVHQILDETNISILPSEREGLPTSMIEAMSYELPVIATNVGGTSELIKNGKNGFLIEPLDKKDLVKKISTLIEDKNLRAKLGKLGRKTIEEKFSIKKMSFLIEKKYLELYSRNS